MRYVLSELIWPNLSPVEQILHHVEHDGRRIFLHQVAWVEFNQNFKARLLVYLSFAQLLAQLLIETLVLYVLSDDRIQGVP